MEYYPAFLQKQIEDEIKIERRMLDIGPAGVSVVEPDTENILKDYQWKLGDTVYIGTGEYEVIESGNHVVTLQDKSFPLSTKSYTGSQLKEILKDNPLNDGLLAPVTAQELLAEKNDKELYDEYLPILVNKIKYSSNAYPALRDRDTSVDEAYDLVREALIDVMERIKNTDSDIYERYENNREFRNFMVDDLVGRLYEDIADANTHSSELVSNLNEYQLYDLFVKISPRIADYGSCLSVMLSKNPQEHPLMISLEREENTVTIFHFYEDNGHEIDEPIMHFHINNVNKTLIPYYYSNQSMGFLYDLEDIEPENQETVIHDMINYANSWFHNILDKNYYLENEQIYKDSNSLDIYHNDYDADGFLRNTDMPIKEAMEYCEKHGYQISKEYMIADEIKIIEEVLASLNIDKIEITWDDEYDCILASDDSHLWSGKQFYDFLLNETIEYKDDKPLDIDDVTYQHLLSYASLQSSPPVEEVPKINYRITDEHLGAGTPKERYRNNIAAIRLLFSLEKENRPATSDEQDILAKYVGWGGLSDVFDDGKSNWSKEYMELKTLLSDEEYAQARESTLTAFYTPPVVIKSIYQVLDNLGFRYGNVLEPACGTGNFFGMLHETMSDSKLYGVELDSITGRIARQLYPNASIAIEGYENTNLPDSFFDVAIGNVPFGQFKVSDKRYDRMNFNIHDYFFAKTIDKVRPGGVIAFITSRYTMDKANSSVRKYISE